MTAQAQKTEREPDDGLTAGERAYMTSGGNVDGLVKEGLEIKEPAAPPAAVPVPDTPDPAADAKPDPAAASAEPPAAEQEAAGDDDDGQPDLDPKTGRPKKKGEWISRKAFEVERLERKRIAQELGVTKEQWARLEERFKVFQEAIAPAQEEAPQEVPLPDPEQDIFGYLRARDARFEKAISSVDQRLGQVNQSTEAQRADTELVNSYVADARRFAGTPEGEDFGHAYRFLIAHRDAELIAAGYDDATERARLITADEQAIVRRTLQGKGSPAERVYALAKARGYVRPAPNGGAAAAAAPANGGANGGQSQETAAPAVASAAAKPSAAEEIARVQKGQEASLSLSNVGGNRPNNLSVMDLVNMPMDEFTKFARQNPNLLEQMAGKG